MSKAERERRERAGYVQEFERVPNEGHCRGKLRWATEKIAAQALSVTAAKRMAAGEEISECRYYYHDECAGWHLTSRPRGNPSRAL